MRYDKRVVFNESSETAYDPELGEKGSKPTTGMVMYCSVSDLGAERKQELFGRIDLNAVMVHHLGNLIVDADYITISGKQFHITSGRQVQGKCSYIAKEVVK